MTTLSQVQQTINYEQFKFRADNRDRIKESHVKALIKSITARNMLEFRPIVVNSEMEILDGQHRLKAAQQMAIPIYYQVQHDFKATDIIAYNCAMNWSLPDYMRFWLTHKKPDYLKLDAFIKQNGLSLGVALNIFIGAVKDGRQAFKDGDFKYEEQSVVGEVDLCWETVGLIRKICGESTYLHSTRFWKSLLKLFRHTEFDKDQWRKNMHLKIDHFHPCANHADFCTMLMGIYNFGLKRKISFTNINDEE